MRNEGCYRQVFSSGYFQLYLGTVDLPIQLFYKFYQGWESLLVSVFIYVPSCTFKPALMDLCCPNHREG